MDHHARVSIVAPVLGSVNLSQFNITHRNSATLLKEGEVDLYQSWSDLDPHPLVGASIFLSW